MINITLIFDLMILGKMIEKLMIERRVIMSRVDEALAKSLSAETPELIPYLSYLLQDLWELGSTPEDMIYLLSRNIQVSDATKILDLACGKGAVSIKLAKTFGCKIKGIDIMPEFIEYARNKSIEFGVDSLCEFMVEDINQSIVTEHGYDIVILGAVGHVLGNQEETLTKLSKVIKSDGYVLLDDGYAMSIPFSNYLTKKQWIETINKTGYQFIDERLVNELDFSEMLEFQIISITKRVNELKIVYPSYAELFDQYLESQMAECDELENDVEGVTLLLRKL